MKDWKSGMKDWKSVAKKWKILILTPYIILLVYALLFGAVELLGLTIGMRQENFQGKVWFSPIIMFSFLIFQAAAYFVIPFILIMTIFIILDLLRKE